MPNWRRFFNPESQERPFDTGDSTEIESKKTSEGSPFLDSSIAPKDRPRAHFESQEKQMQDSIPADFTNKPDQRYDAPPLRGEDEEAQLDDPAIGFNDGTKREDRKIQQRYGGEGVYRGGNTKYESKEIPRDGRPEKIAFNEIQKISGIPKQGGIEEVKSDRPDGDFSDVETFMGRREEYKQFQHVPISTEDVKAIAGSEEAFWKINEILDDGDKGEIMLNTGAKLVKNKSGVYGIFPYHYAGKDAQDIVEAIDRGETGLLEQFAHSDMQPKKKLSAGA